jgi:hypothetical protein
MPRRKSPYPDKPYVPTDDARRRLAALMEPEVRDKLKLQEKWVPRGGWQLWNWQTLEDVKFD